MKSKSKHKNSAKQIIILTFIMLLAIVLIFFVVKNIFTIRNNIIISSETSMFASRINTRITEEQVHMRSLAENFGKLTTPGSEDAEKLLAITSAASNLDKIFAVDKSGNYQSEGSTINVQEQPYFKVAATGSDCADAIIIGESRSVVISSPIFNASTLSGVMIGTVDTHRESNNFLKNTFNGNGCGFLIKSNGDIIVESYSDSSIIDCANILDFIRNITNNPIAAEDMLTRMALNETGVINTIFNGKTLSGFYAPVNINGWYAVGLDLGILATQEKNDIKTIMTSVVLILLLLYIIIVWALVRIKRKSNDTINRARNNFDMLVSNMKSGVIKTYFRDNPWEIVPSYVSEQFTKNFGYTSESFNGENIKAYVDIIDVRDRERIVKEFTAVSYPGHYHFEYRIKAADGSIRYVTDDGSILPFPLSENKLLGVVTDVTDEVIMKNDLEICERSLNVANELSSTTVFEVDLRKGSYVKFNNCENLLGFNEADLLKTLNDANSDTALNLIYHPDDLEYAQEMRALLYAERRAQYSARLKHKDGNFIWCRITTILFCNTDNEPIKILGHILDIDNSKSAAQSLFIENETDKITGFLNAPAFRRHATREMLETKKATFTLMVAKIDALKADADIASAIDITRELIKINVEPRDILGFLEESKFSVLMADVETTQHAEKAAKGFIDEFHRRAGRDYSCCIGLAVVPSTTIPGKVMRLADEALNKAFSLGANQFYVSDMFDVEE